MASNTRGQFTSHWYGYCKDTIKQLWGGEQCTHFSEGLLYAMYYETDVGCIPRGIKLDTKTPSKYSSSKNWNKKISGCYWCRGHSTTHNGICCSKECFFYLHDWCIERVVYFTGRRFCRLPGCSNNTQNNKLYCNDTDRAKFDSLFPKGYDHEYVLKTVIREGPSWYNPNDNENVLIHSQNKNTVSTCPFQSDFPPELQELISVHTDIGNIPRDTFSSFHLQTKFSHYPNWSAIIEGCYNCGRADIIDSTNKYFCRIRCYLIFYEWCRSNIESVTEIRFCQYAGCPKRASQGYPCCNSEHSIGIEELYKVNSIKDIGRTSKITPPWYTKSYSPNELVPNLSSCPTNSRTPPVFNQPPQKPHNQPRQKPHNQPPNQPPQKPHNQPPQKPHNQPPQQPPNQPPQKPPQQPNHGPNFIFSLELTQYLYFYTDVGPIPREIRSHRPPPDSVSLQNWNTNITMCYWCCQGPHDVKSIACSHKCLFLFNEWLHNIYEKSSNKQLCKNIGCNSLRYPGFQCCNRDHSSYYDSCFKHYNQYLKSTEFALGPLWYTKSFSPDELVPNVSSCPTSSQTTPVFNQPPQPDEQVSSIKPKGEIKSEVIYQKHRSPYTSKHILTSQSKNSLVSSTPISDVTQLFDSSIEEIESNPILPLEDKKEVPECNYDNSNPFKMGVLNQQEVTTKISSGSQRNPFLNIVQEFNELLPFTLSRKLTDLLAQRTDVGIIPRSEYQSAVSSPKYSNNSNWTADIPTCYWCELSNTSFHVLTCSRKCWLLFHEWCVRKVESGCGFRLCVLPGCENSRFTGCSCCSLEHIQRISELRGSLSVSIEEEVELTLGPKWYTDLSPIYFSRTGAFYEFSNYFPSLLLLNGLAWPTVYHYLCAQKLIGTPYGNQISGMECINELERWMKRRTLGKWMRPDWDRICEGATYKAVFTKFEQNKVLKGMLLKTGRRPLVCGDGTLGDMLVSLREWFRTYRYPNQPSTNLPLTPNVAIAIPEIVSKTSPPVTDTESQPQDIVVPKCEYTGSDDSDSNDEVTDIIQASFDTDFSDDD